MAHEVPVIECQHEGCERSYKEHRWGAIKAHGEGWFLARDGRAWCPEHVPDWVAGWRRQP